jgi:TolB protein
LSSLGLLLAPTVLGWAWFFPQEPQQQTPRIVIVKDVTRFAIPDCVPRAGDEASREACRTLTRVLRADLKFESLFQFVREDLYSAVPAGNPDSPRFDDWKGATATHLVVTRAALTGGELTVELKLYFVESGQVMLAKRYSGKADNPRVFAHQASDDIMALTQFRGVARTKIAFSSDRDVGAKGRRPPKELYIVDYDGYNPRRVTVNGSLNMLPTWRPDGRSIAYVSYRQGPARIYLASIFEGRSTGNLTSEPGDRQATSPSFSPDGSRIAFASTRSGNFEIWVANADGSGAKRLTSHPGSDTAPTWSPTGKEIAFTSDRGGTPQIWVMDDEGLNLRRLTTIGGHNDSPAWNPSKVYPEIAFTSRIEGGFEIAVFNIETGQFRQITQGRGSCEYPSWAPSGRHLAFSCRRGGNWQLSVSDREGRTVQTLAVGPGNNVYPEWGP